MKGVVLEGTGGQWRVRGVDGAEVLAALRGRLKQSLEMKLAVGDEVVLDPPSVDGELWAITEIQPRRSRLARRNPSGSRGERVIAANLDQVVVVFAMRKPEPNAKMLDRFLVIAEANELPARIVVNKVDLASQHEAETLFAPYETLGYEVHYTSVREGRGLTKLHDALLSRVSALTGPSGVGKSSLLNALYPSLALRVGEISESVNKGRHTTVGAMMHPLPDSGFVVDTPGLREVGLWGLPPESLDSCFPEFRAALGACRFRDCRHLQEPACAVREAVAAGRVLESRYESYVKLYEELQSSAEEH